MLRALALVVLILIAPTARAEPVPLRIASYNTWLFPHFSEDLSARRQAMVPAIQALEPDVLCMQEVWDSRSLGVLAAGLRRQLPYRAVGGGGLALLSRWPIVEVRFDAYRVHPSLSMAERFGKKGMLAVVIVTPAGYVRLVDTHLAHERGGDGQAHAAQVAQLVASLQVDHVPTIVCGDLNHTAVVGGRASLEMAAFMALGFSDAAGAGKDGAWTPRARTRIGWPRNRPPRGGDPDYVLFRGSDHVAVELVGWQQRLDTPETALSDHNLQLVDLRLIPR